MGPLLFMKLRPLLLTVTAVVAFSSAWAQRGVISPSQQAYAQQAQALRDLQRSVQVLAARFEAVDTRLAALASRIEMLERGGESATKAEVSALRADLAALRSSQGALRDEIVGELAGRMAALQTRQAAQARAERAAAAQKSGYSHTVEAGQTLSAIAQHYKVSVKDIMRANKLSDPSLIRVGQVLFVPDP